MHHFIFAALTICILCSCDKSNVIEPKKKPDVNIDFIKFTISEGKQFCNNNIYVTTSYSELKFLAKFDSSAIYTTTDPSNQDDINKLYGFADNNTTHQKYSARFGWCWYNNALRLYGYIYNSGIRDSKELGTVAIGYENNCSIKVTPTAYQFTLNGKVDSLPRSSNTIRAEGYKLYPYFGGNESAPHTINIFIKELEN